MQQLCCVGGRITCAGKREGPASAYRRAVFVPIIQIALIKKGMSVKDLAASLGCTSQNISGKFKRDNFSEKELQEIADAMGCEFRGLFIDKETGEEI